MKFISVLLCLALLFSGVYAMEIREEEEDFRKERERKEEILAALFESDISSARQALDNRLITCVELTQYFLERIEAYNDTFNCFITLCDNALEEAKQRDALLRKKGEHHMLLGIPIVVKDNIAYEGYPTTNGFWRFGNISWENATVVQRLLDAGAVVLGKSNMSTEAQDAQYSASDAVGETLNAYGVELSAGGSSGGSASAVSLNFCYAGLGTDTNASLRYPAVLNGCISLRPTKGLLDRQGVIILNYTRDVPGVITRSVEDQAIVLGEMAGIDYYSSLDENVLEGMRIGILMEFCYSDIARSYRWESKMDPEIKTAFYEAADNLRSLGAKVFHVSIPNIFTLAQNCGNNSSYAIERYLSVYEELFTENKLDAVIFPTYLHTPDNSIKHKGWSQVSYDAFYSNCSLLSSPLGVPEMAIPIAYHSKGSGIGMEIAALKGQEQLLLNMAYTYIKNYDTRRVPETAPSLYSEGRSIHEILAAEVPTPPPEVTEPSELPEMPETAETEATAAQDIYEENNLTEIPTDETEAEISPPEEDSLPEADLAIESRSKSALPLVITMITILLPAGAWVLYKYLTEAKQEPESEMSRDKKSRKSSKSKDKKKRFKKHSRKRKIHK